MIITNGKYYVYVHINKINGKMYVGQTCRKPEYRWDNGNGYKNSRYFWRAICKYGWDNFDHEVVASNLTKEEADNFEKLLINKLDTMNQDKGYNMTMGGEGSVGCVLSEETRQKMSKSRMGRQVSAETRKKISEGHKGKRLSASTRNKLREINIGKSAGSNNPSARAVYQIDKDTNEIIARFETMLEASLQTGASYTHICSCCRGTRSISGGFKWTYADA